MICANALDSPSHIADIEMDGQHPSRWTMEICQSLLVPARFAQRMPACPSHRRHLMALAIQGYKGVTEPPVLQDNLVLGGIVDSEADSECLKRARKHATHSTACVAFGG